MEKKKESIVENNKQVKTKIRKLEYILALSFVLPYMEIGAIRNVIEYDKNGIIIFASIFIMLAITIVLTIAMKLSSRRKRSHRLSKIIYLKIILDFLILMRGMFADNFLVFFAQYLWFVIPFYYAVIIIKCIDYFNLKISNVGKMGLLYFAFYIFVNAVINLQQYGFTFSGMMVESRVVSPSGGPVILGYTIVIITCYLLYNRSIISRINILLGICIFFVGAILTGSRVAIWSMMLLLFLYIITNKKAKVQLISIFLFIIVTIIFNPVSFVADLVPRTIDLSGGVRADTVVSAIKVFYEQPILTMLFGTGLSACFPYQLWLSNRGDVVKLLSYNTFLYNGQIMLVQPHNSYMYLLLEAGIIGLLLFLAIFIKAFNMIKAQASDNKRYRYLLVLFIVVLNYFDSVLIIQPGSAGLWWLLLFFAICDSRKPYYSVVDSCVDPNIIEKNTLEG